MALYPITVNTPVEALPHIYAEDDAAIYESISGGDGVYDIGEMLKATVLSNNNVRIGNGVLSVGGHIARIKYGDYEEMTIDNGESGKNRNDLIVARFSTTGFGGVDEFSLEVKKGVAVTGAAKDPEVETGNLYEGETIREFPLHRVRLEGISIVAVDQLFAVRKTNEQLQKEVDELNRKLQADNDWSTYSDNGWTLKYRHITANLISVEASRTSTGNNAAVAGDLVMAGIPFDVAFPQSVQCTMDVSGNIVGNGRARFADNNGLYLYTPGYGNPVTYTAFGIVAVK